MVLSTKNEHPGSVNTFDIYVIDEDLTETHCGTYETSGDRRGFEAWCNLQTKSFRIEGTPTDPANWKVFICSLGAFGSIYEHESPVPTSVALRQGQQAPAMTLDHVKSRLDVQVTNVLDINLRQKAGSELPWVTIENDQNAATVRFEQCPPDGNYTLILESIDLNSPKQDLPVVLKTEVIDLTVSIYVTNDQRALCSPNKLIFEHEPEFIEMTVGQEQSWTLPKVVNPLNKVYKIVAQADIPLIPFLTFKE